MTEQIKYPEELREDDFDRMVDRMVKDRKLVEQMLDRLNVLEGFVEEVDRIAKNIK